MKLREKWRQLDKQREGEKVREIEIERENVDEKENHSTYTIHTNMSSGIYIKYQLTVSSYCIFALGISDFCH